MAKQPKRGRPPETGETMTKIVFVRMTQADYDAFELEATRLADATGVPVSVPAYLRMAGRYQIMRGKKLTG